MSVYVSVWCECWCLRRPSEISSLELQLAGSLSMWALQELEGGVLPAEPPPPAEPTVWCLRGEGAAAYLLLF